jgi:hypothetical protein
MGLMLLLGAESSAIMLLTLFGAVLLTMWDCRTAQMGWRLILWWVSLVLLIHVIGYLALRLWLVTRRGENVAA